MPCMTAKQKRALAVRCPTCGAKVGEKCELGTGQPRTEPHRDRRLVGAAKKLRVVYQKAGGLKQRVA